MDQGPSKRPEKGDLSAQQGGGQLSQSAIFEAITQEFLRMRGEAVGMVVDAPHSNAPLNGDLGGLVTSLLQQLPGQHSGAGSAGRPEGINTPRLSQHPRHHIGAAVGGRYAFTPNMASSGLPIFGGGPTNIAPVRHSPLDGDEQQVWLSRVYDTEKSGASFIPNNLNNERRSCELNANSLVAWIAGVGTVMGTGFDEHARATWATWFGGPNVGKDSGSDLPPHGHIKMTGDPKIPRADEIKLLAEITGASNALELLNRFIREPIRPPNFDLRDRSSVTRRNPTNQLVILSSSAQLVGLITGTSNIPLLEQVEKAFWMLNRIVQRFEKKNIAVHFRLIDEAENTSVTHLAESVQTQAARNTGVTRTL